VEDCREGSQGLDCSAGDDDDDDIKCMTRCCIQNTDVISITELS